VNISHSKLSVFSKINVRNKHVLNVALMGTVACSVWLQECR